MKTCFAVLMGVYWTTSFGQQIQSPGQAHCMDPGFNRMVDRYLSYQVAVVDVDDALQFTEAIFLDAREIEEYTVSHIPGARHVGYKSFEAEALSDIDKETPVIVYCSIGYRSEKIGKKIKDLGYSRVYNLYGSIFEWANRGHPLENDSGQSTTAVHTFNRSWSQWVLNPGIQKIW